MSEQSEFYCDSSGYSKSTWYVRRQRGNVAEIAATFHGLQHAEADAREHAERCEARAAEEREAARPWPRFTAEPRNSTDDRGCVPWCVIARSLPVSKTGYICREFSGDGAKLAAHALAERLNAAVAEPETGRAEPPKGPRYVAENNTDSWLVLDSRPVENGPWIARFWVDGERLARGLADQLNREAGLSDTLRLKPGACS